MTSFTDEEYQAAAKYWSDKHDRVFGQAMELKRERDAARRERDNFRSELAAYQRSHERMKDERDMARTECRLLHERINELVRVDEIKREYDRLK